MAVRASSDDSRRLESEANPEGETETRGKNGNFAAGVLVLGAAPLRTRVSLNAMLELLQHDDVTQLRMSSFGSRRAGLAVSAYLVHGVLVDSGFPRARSDFARALESLRPSGAMITHWHEDHAGNVAHLAAHGVPTWLSDETRAILGQAPAIRLYRRVVWGTPPRLARAPEPFSHPALHPIATPGHSPEHHAIWDADTETLFSGDLWLGVRARVMHEDEHPRAIVASLERVRALRPRRMFDAHRGPVTDPVAALDAKIDWMRETIGAIERRVADGWSDRAIVGDVLGGEEWVARASLGEYARKNLVAAVRAGR